MAMNELFRDSEWFDGELLSRVHHDFKNDLNLLTNYGEMLSSEDANGESLHVVSKKITGSLNALLAGLRLETGSLTASPEQLEPLVLLEERIDWFRPLFKYVNRDFEFTVERSPGSLRYDRQFLRLVLDGLLLLSAEEPDGKTKVTVSGTTGSSPSKCFITVRNTNPPWVKERTPELERVLRHESLQELVSKFSSRIALFLHSIRRLLETQEGNLEIPSVRDDGVILEAIVRHQDLGPRSNGR